MRLFLPIVLAGFALALPGGGAASSCPSLRLTGTPGADSLNGTSKGEHIDGLGGDDVIAGNAGADCIFGGDGDDHLEGGFGRDVLDGGSGDDLIGGGQEASVIRAGSGDDRVSSSNGVADSVDCGGGTDRVVADRSDRLSGCETVRYAVSPYPLVTPAAGGSRTTFTVYFRALYPASNESGGQYVIGAVHSGPCGTGFSSLGRISSGPYKPGQIVRFVLRPPPHGGWCRGLFRGVGHWEKKEGATTRDVRLGRFFFRIR
jgi:hemolysin type calcium-binding protein